MLDPDGRPPSVHSIPEGVHRLDRLDLHCGPAPWPMERLHAVSINAHWAAMRARNPKYFDGVVHVATAAAIVGDTLTGRLAACNFKSFLYHREHPEADPTARDMFGSAIVVSADGAVMLGVQADGNLNAGLAYPPSGMIDRRDIGGDGRVDLAASAERELEEETGLTAADVARVPGIIVTAVGTQLAVGTVFRSRLTARELECRVVAHLARDPVPELTHVVFARARQDARTIASPPFVPPLIEHLFQNPPHAGIPMNLDGAAVVE